MRPYKKEVGTFESFDGTPIYYEVRGSGKPLVFSYGIVSTINHWRHQLKYFSPNYTTIVFDYRGHHKTPAPKDRENLSVDAIAQDISGLVKHLGFKCADFIGHSFGCQVLVRTYDMYPEIFSRLALVNGFVADPLKNMFGNNGATTGFQLVKTIYQQLPETLSYLWKTLVDNPISMRMSALAGGFNLDLTSFKDIEIYAKGVGNIDLDVFIQIFNSMVSYDATPVLSRIQIPTLLIAGNKDKVTPVNIQYDLHNRISGSELIIVPFGTHCTQLDMPDLVNLKLESFLKKDI